MKKIFLSLLLGFVGLISFSNAGFNDGSDYFLGTISWSSENSISRTYNLSTISEAGTYLIIVNGANSFCPGTITDSTCFGKLRLYVNGVELYVSNSVDGVISYSFSVSEEQLTNLTLLIYSRLGSSSISLYKISTSSSCPECETCPEINTGDILSGSCDTNYCVENDLCPTSSGSWSELKINDIVHEGKPFINISIPDYIYWDYTTDENQFDLYVGSGYDQDYIDSILAINSYRPDNEDFTNIFVSGLTLIFPYIFVALLIVFIWKLLKRIFK